MVGELGSRLTGSSDLFEHRGRRPWASVNFVTAHDGFTLQDLVSYSSKHNEANGEGNRDGTDHNHSWNCGVEGPTDDRAIRELRLQHKRNLLATLLLSQGVPMLLAGDEFGRTQHGNNNAYCQDNALSWLDWEGIDEDGQRLLEFTRRLLRFRHEHIVFHRHRFFQGLRGPDSPVKDIAWLRPDGMEKMPEDWTNADSRSLAFLLSGSADDYHLNSCGEPEQDQTFFVILNASPESESYLLPRVDSIECWEPVLETASGGPGERPTWQAGERYPAAARSVTVFIGRDGTSDPLGPPAR